MVNSEHLFHNIMMIVLIIAVIILIMVIPDLIARSGRKYYNTPQKRGR